MGDIVRLIDKDGVTTIDSVSCDYEDSFCLDTFGDLVEAHRAAEPKGKKCFILARVQTLDPKQPNKAFYSYYNAFSLNKILFQTQNYLGKRFIHRLHVLNPLTNSDIIGDVQYFMVSPEVSVVEEIKEDEEVHAAKTTKEGDADKPKGNVAVTTPQISVVIDQSEDDGDEQKVSFIVPGGFEDMDGDKPGAKSDVSESMRKNIAASGRLSTTGYESQPLTSTMDGYKTSQPLLSESLNVFHANSQAGQGDTLAAHLRQNRKLSLRIRVEEGSFFSPTRRMSDQNGLPIIALDASANGINRPANWTLAGHAVEDMSEETSLANTTPTQRRGSAISVNVRASIANAKRALLATTNAVSPPRRSSMIKLPTRTRSMSLVISRAENTIPEGLKARRKTEFTIPVMTLTPINPVRVHQITRAQIQLGVVTRFTVPVPHEELAKIVPKTYRGHRRSLSFQNAVSASGSPATFEDWIRMVQRERAEIKRGEKIESGDEYDVVYPFSLSMMSPRLPVHESTLGPIADEFASPEAMSPEKGVTHETNAAVPKAEVAHIAINVATVPDSRLIMPIIDATPSTNLNISNGDAVAINLGSNSSLKKSSQPQAAASITTSSHSINKDTAENILGIKIYDAIFIATDTDFLESSKTRMIFRENAIVPEDAKLFEMPAYTGEETFPPPVEIIDENLFCDCCYPSPETLARASPLIKAFHKYKCHIVISIVIILVSAFILVIIIQGSRSK